ncbi:lipopolysaccharide biosynthesis protein [Microbacterium dauci]|uniref:Lipopolysaccharide biosynthesis protein n=1 Tax=Microbacterium dauci TaxID=3048008 RepID=A0ABT6Z9V8_9MICO|nr:lipopolysaccharide biosynthesis protein [Microbacterium sp. LX3-4]MDJ1112941.1 lipopolysaccharide biosynthesis protein [Microbacterium sp. LX3-4]
MTDGEPPVAPEGPSLRARAARGSAVTLVTQLSRSLVLLGGTIILARMVAPSDFGLVAMVVAVSGIAEILRDSGLSWAALRRTDLTQQQRSNLFWINAGIGLALGAIIFGLSWPLAAFYGIEELVPVVQWIAPIYFFNGLATQFRVAINLDLRFARLAIIDIAAPVVALALAIWLAIGGQGLAALVVQQLATAVVALLLTVPLARWWPSVPRRAPGMRALIGFGARFAGVQLLSYGTRNVDSIAIGRAYGPRDVGLYDQAYQLAVAPLVLLNSPMSRVAVPVLARVQDDRDRYMAGLRDAQLIACYVTSTVLLVAAGVGTPLITMLLGENWAAAGPIFSVLAIGSVFRSIQQVANWIFVVEDRTKSMLRLSLVGQPIIVALILLGLIWGPVGVAAGGALGWCIFWLLSLAWVRRATGLAVRPLLVDAIRIIVLVGLPAGAAALLVALFVPLAPVWVVVLGVLAAGAWCGVITLVSSRVRADVRTLTRFVRLAVKGK